MKAQIGSLGGSWSLDSLALASQNVAFAMDFRVEVIGRSCGLVAKPWGAVVFLPPWKIHIFAPENI